MDRAGRGGTGALNPWWASGLRGKVLGPEILRWAGMGPLWGDSAGASLTPGQL